MDYRINNEALVGCVIMQLMRRGPYEVPFVVGMVNLLLQKKLKNKVLNTGADNVEMLGMLFGQIDGDLLDVIINSLTMLIEGRCLKRQDSKLQITDSGQHFCEDMGNGKSKILSDILKGSDEVLFKYDSIDKSLLYNKMWIAE